MITGAALSYFIIRYAGTVKNLIKDPLSLP